MSKKEKRGICFHDYVTVDSSNVGHAARKIVFDNGDFTKPEVLWRYAGLKPDKMLYDRACLKCRKCISDLTDFKKKVAAISQSDIWRIEEEMRQEFIESAKAAKQARERTHSARKIFWEEVEA